MYNKIIAFYLIRKLFSVFYNNAKSNFYIPTSGVTQDLNLDSLLFLMFINDFSTIYSIKNIYMQMD